MIIVPRGERFLFHCNHFLDSQAPGFQTRPQRFPFSPHVWSHPLTQAAKKHTMTKFENRQHENISWTKKARPDRPGVPSVSLQEPTCPQPFLPWRKKHLDQYSLKKIKNLQTAMGGSTANTVSGVDRRCSQRLMPSYVWSLSENDIFFRHKISAASFALTSLRVILRLTQARCITIGIERQWAFGLKSVPRATTIPQLIMSLIIFFFFEELTFKSSQKRSK